MNLSERFYTYTYSYPNGVPFYVGKGTKKRIENNPGLLLHMSYATWNGPGFFQKFAEKIDRAVKEGKSDEELLDIAKNSRTNAFTGYWAKATTKVNSLIDKTAGMA